MTRQTSVSDPSQATPRQAILDSAIEAISIGGEASVRIVEIAKSADVTQGMVAYYFNDREGLITEAQVARYSAVIDNDLDVIRDAASNAASPADFRKRMVDLIEQVLAAERRPNRRLRASVLGSAVNRPQLMDRIIGAQSSAIDRLAEYLGIGQQRGVIRSDINPRGVAELITAYIVGLVIVEFDPSQTSTQDKVATFDLFLSSLMP